MSAIELEAETKQDRYFETPEGVPLRVVLGARSERASAFALDIVFQLLAILAVWIGMGLTLGRFISGGWLLAFLLLISFFIRAFYFSYFEIRWQGRTPGKRIVGLKVVDRFGGPLTPEAILTRNFMREVEVFLPLSILLTSAIGGASYFANLLLTIWVCIFMFMPLFNRDALRAGDMVAGTWVIRAPKEVLLPDLAASADQEDEEETYRFTHDQLRIYGIKELQVLEDVLRHDSPHAEEMQIQVAERIRKKIGWGSQSFPTRDTAEFLEAFYRALRRHLEQRMLFGHKKKSKLDNDS